MLGRAAAAISGWLVLLAAMGPPALASSYADTSVVGGTPAARGALPFMAYIEVDEGSELTACSGTVVSSNIILTAAHCVLNQAETGFRDSEAVRVLTGTNNILSGGTVSNVERLAIDPSYRSSGAYARWHDAGVVQLTGPVSAPAVALSTVAPSVGTAGTIAGWGVTSPYQEGPSPELEIGRTVVQTSNWCRSAIGPSFHPLAEICTIDYPTYAAATCHGDSGGPLLKVISGQYVEVGITSFGIEEGCPTNAPRVDTRADVEAGWVRREISSHPPELPRLSNPEATADTFSALSTDSRLRSRFQGRSSYRISCYRISDTSRRCGVSWYRPPNDYYGYVTIYITWEGSQVVWDYRYTMRWVNDYCYFQSGHPGRCPVVVRSG